MCQRRSRTQNLHEAQPVLSTLQNVRALKGADAAVAASTIDPHVLREDALA